MQNKSTKPKKSIPSPIISPKTQEISLYINSIVLNALQIEYKETIGLLGVRVCQGTLVLSKEQAIAFRGIFKNIYESKITIEVKCGEIEVIDILTDCRIVDIENIQNVGSEWIEKIKLDVASIQYGKILN